MQLDDKAGRPVRVLLVEDDPGDVELTREAMSRSKLRVVLDVVEDGVDAMAYLRKEGPYSKVSRPDLILLDLNMPRKSGREVLEEIKNDEKLKRIPVVILTTSASDEDIIRSYTLGAACYVTKPVGFQEFSKVVESIQNFWFTVVCFPPSD